jgi:hypothetical protein
MFLHLLTIGLTSYLYPVRKYYEPKNSYVLCDREYKWMFSLSDFPPTLSKQKVMLFATFLADLLFGVTDTKFEV